MDGQVVDPSYKRILKANPPSRAQHVVAAVLDQSLQGIVGCGRDQLLPQLLVGGMQADGQGNLQLLLGQPGDLPRHAHRREGDVPLADANILIEAANGLHHGVAVEQGLPHAHENHVADAAAKVFLHR
jgi:hypothetical protein